MGSTSGLSGVPSAQTGTSHAHCCGAGRNSFTASTRSSGEGSSSRAAADPSRGTAEIILITWVRAKRSLMRSETWAEVIVELDQHLGPLQGRNAAWIQQLVLEPFAVADQ